MRSSHLLKSFAVDGQLLGDIIFTGTGRDVDVSRLQTTADREIREDGCTFLYRHSTLVSFDGLVLGNARVYWFGEDDCWQVIARDRMKEILRRLGYQALHPAYDPSSRTLRRLLRAIAPKGGLMIAESLFLGNIQFVLDTAEANVASGFRDD
jgi:hypothetical protein